MNKGLRFSVNSSDPLGINGLGILLTSDWIRISKTNDNILGINIGLQEVGVLYAKEQTCGGVSWDIVDHGVIIYKNRLE